MSTLGAPAAPQRVDGAAEQRRLHPEVAGAVTFQAEHRRRTTLRLQPGGQGGEALGAAAVARHEHDRAEPGLPGRLERRAGGPTPHEHRDDDGQHQRHDDRGEDTARLTTQRGQWHRITLRRRHARMSPGCRTVEGVACRGRHLHRSHA